jgi:hypothetical protein
MSEAIIPRQSVGWFANRMEERLQANDRRGRYGWRETCTAEHLLKRLHDEFFELTLEQLRHDDRGPREQVPLTCVLRPAGTCFSLWWAALAEP